MGGKSSRGWVFAKCACEVTALKKKRHFSPLTRKFFGKPSGRDRLTGMRALGMPLLEGLVSQDSSLGLGSRNVVSKLLKFNTRLPALRMPGLVVKSRWEPGSSTFRPVYCVRNAWPRLQKQQSLKANSRRVRMARHGGDSLAPFPVLSSPPGSFTV